MAGMVTAPGLAEFLLARIAEDEAVARDAYGVRWEVIEGVNASQVLVHRAEIRDDKWRVGHLGHVAMVERLADVEHIVRWHPARVLAECEAKRLIVEQYAEYLSTVRAYRSPRWSDAMNEQDKENARQAEARHRVAEDVAKLLALPYADHPDYREEWRP